MQEFFDKLDKIIKSYEDIVLVDNTTTETQMVLTKVLFDLMELRYDPTGEKKKLWARLEPS